MLRNYTSTRHDTGEAALRRFLLVPLGASARPSPSWLCRLRVAPPTNRSVWRRRGPNGGNRRRSAQRSRSGRCKMPAVSPFLVTPRVATRLRCSVRTVHELTRRGLIPHRRLPGPRRCLFREDELEAWEQGGRPARGCREAGALPEARAHERRSPRGCRARLVLRAEGKLTLLMGRSQIEQALTPESAPTPWRRLGLLTRNITKQVETRLAMAFAWKGRRGDAGASVSARRRPKRSAGRGAERRFRWRRARRFRTPSAAAARR